MGKTILQYLAVRKLNQQQEQQSEEEKEERLEQSRRYHSLFGRSPRRGKN